MRSIVFAIVLAIAFLIAPSAHAQSDSIVKTNDIRLLLNLMDVGPAMQQSLSEEIASGRANPEAELPPNFWDEFEKEALNSVSSFVERLIPTYDAEFSHDEIKSLIEIYRSPVMKKMNAAQHSLSDAAAKAGEAWGQEIGLRVVMKMDTSSEDAVPTSATPTSPAPAGKESKPEKKKK